MSSHALSASGRRALSTTVNDDARTSAQVPSKPGDAASLNMSGFTRIELSLGAHARIERRRYTRNGTVYETNVLVIERVDGEPGLTAAVASLQGYGVSETPSEGVASSWPHTSIDVRKPDGKWNPVNFGQSVEVIETLTLRGMVTSENSDEPSSILLSDE
jgi:hypothetical protein